MYSKPYGNDPAAALQAARQAMRENRWEAAALICQEMARAGEGWKSELTTEDQLNAGVNAFRKDVSIRNSETLTRLPTFLRVAGDVRIENCPNLTTLPEVLIVNGDLYIANCPLISKMPLQLEVNKHLRVFGCEGPLSFPGTCKIRMRSRFSEGTCLSAIPPGLDFPGGLSIADTPVRIQQFPPNYVAAGTLSFIDIPETLDLPEGLQVGSTLSFKRCEGLHKLPGGLQVGSGMLLDSCLNLEKLGQDTQVGGTLLAAHCPNLRSLPEGLRIEGDLEIKGCPNLESLPESLEVCGYIYLEGTGPDLKVGRHRGKILRWVPN